jgi:site-specific recombinase XerD
MPGVSLASLDTASLDTYFDDLVFNAQAKGADGRSSSVNARACFIHFFDWAVSKKLVSSNPAKETRQRKYKPSHAKVPDEDLSRYLVVLRKMRQAPKPERLAVTHYLWLMALTGYRKAELATATIGDFYLDERKRRINVEQAKDDEDHYIGLSHMAVRAVR